MVAERSVRLRIFMVT